MKQPNTPIAQRLWEYGAILALLIFFPGIWVLLALDARSEDKAHHAFLAQLNGLSTVFELELNGKRIDDPSRLVSDLKQVQRYRGHHAPGRKPKWYRIDITDDQRTLRFLLASPENPADRYWVFLPGGDSTHPERARLGTRIGGFVDPELAAVLIDYERH